jgi:hypothetical protein
LLTVGIAGLYTVRNRHLLRQPYLVAPESSVLEFILESSGNQHGVHAIDLPLHQLLMKLYWNVQVETELKSMKDMERYSSDVVKQVEALAKKFLLSLYP